MQIFQVKQNRERYTGSWTNIVILVGANDLGYNDEDSVMTDIHGLLAELQSLNPGADVDVCEVLPRRAWTRDDVPSSLHPNEHALRFNAFLHREFPGRVVNLYCHFVGVNRDVLGHLFKKDGLHPTLGQAPFLRSCILKHLKSGPAVEYYDSWPMPQFYQPGVKAVTAKNKATSPTTPTSPANYTVTAGSGETYSMGSKTKIVSAKGKNQIYYGQYEVPAPLCGVIIGNVSLLVIKCVSLY